MARRSRIVTASKDPPRRGPGRPATGHDPLLTLRIPAAAITAIDAALADGETRSDLIRQAIEREIARRIDALRDFQ